MLRITILIISFRFLGSVDWDGRQWQEASWTSHNPEMYNFIKLSSLYRLLACVILVTVRLGCFLIIIVFTEEGLCICATNRLTFFKCLTLNRQGGRLFQSELPRARSKTSALASETLFWAEKMSVALARFFWAWAGAVPFRSRSFKVPSSDGNRNYYAICR